MTSNVGGEHCDTFSVKNLVCAGSRSRFTSSAVRNAVVDGSVQILRRSASHVHLHPRTHSPPITEPSTSRTPDTPENEPSVPSGTPDPEKESLAQIRACLLPPPIPGVKDWGIPPPTDEPCNPSLKVGLSISCISSFLVIFQGKFAQFFELKHGDPPKHFNDSLMSNRSFRNPHLYAKLVEFVDVDETCSNIPKVCNFNYHIQNRRQVTGNARVYGTWMI